MSANIAAPSLAANPAARSRLAFRLVSARDLVISSCGHGVAGSALVVSSLWKPISSLERIIFRLDTLISEKGKGVSKRERLISRNEPLISKLRSVVSHAENPFPARELAHQQRVYAGT